MNKRLKRAVSLLLVLAMLALVCASVAAESYVKGSNSASSSYQNSKYYSYLTSLPLTGDGRRDVVAVALSQVGYQEGASSGSYGGLSGGSGNYTEYNYNMGSIGSYSYAWCASFVSWSLLQSRCTTQNTQSAWCRNNTGDSSYIWREVSCSQWATQLRRYGYFQKSAAAGGSYTPQSGDLIFFSWSGATSSEDHIGLVVYSDGSKVYTIEGNTSDQAGLEDNGGGAYFKSYSLSYKYITGYGVLPYKTVSDLPRIDYSMSNPVKGLYMTYGTTPIYTSSTGTSYTYKTAKFIMFEATEVASNGRLKATVTTSSGTSTSGWVSPSNCVPIYSTEPAGSSSTQSLSISHATVVSGGASYTTTAPNRGDIYDDDGVKLTDGVSIPQDPGSSQSTSWTKDTNPVEIVLDLGEAKWTNQYNVYLAGGNWGIGIPENEITVEIQVSNDKSRFETVSPAGAGEFLKTSGTGAADNTWSTYNYYAAITKDVKARYIKFVIRNTAGGFVWLTEVDATLNMNNDTVITGFDEAITSGRTVIFTKSFNGGALTQTNTNTEWTTNIIVEWNSEIGQYVVINKTEGLASGWNLKDGQLLIASHSWEGDDLDGSVAGSQKNRANLQSESRFQVGDIVRFNGIDVDKKLLDPNAYIESVAYLGDVNKDLSVDALDYVLLKRSCLGTYSLSGGASLSADINATGKADASDYALLRRYCIGSYSIDQNF